MGGYDQIFISSTYNSATVTTNQTCFPGVQINTNVFCPPSTAERLTSNKNFGQTPLSLITSLTSIVKF